MPGTRLHGPKGRHQWRANSRIDGSIAGAGVVMQLALGAVYAWSVFRIPLTTAYGWTISQVTLTFELAILMLGLASFAGGLWMQRVGPRRVAIAAGVCYGLGTILAGQAGGTSRWLYLSYGMLGGIGLGLGYIVPLATLIKWFPDRRGMITGLAVAGFGAGALVTAPLAEYLLASGRDPVHVRHPRHDLSRRGGRRGGSS